MFGIYHKNSVYLEAALLSKKLHKNEGLEAKVTGGRLLKKVRKTVENLQCGSEDKLQRHN